VKVGDLVRNLNSESGMLGIVLRTHHARLPSGIIVAWNDGRTSAVLRRMVKVMNENR
jgi:hypothetical protein